VKVRSKLIESPDGSVILEKTVDISDLLALNKLERQIIGKGFSKGRTWRKIASIPIEVFLAMPPEKAQEILNDPRAMKRFLREHPEFRVSEGKI